MLRCESCGTTAPPHFVACPTCHSLFHAKELVHLDALASAHEAKAEVTLALTSLRQMLPLLPAQSTQAAQLKERIVRLEGLAAKAPGAPSAAPKVLAGLGAVGAALWKFGAPLFALLSKGKLLLFGLMKAPTLLSMFVSASLWGSMSGVGVALVAVGSIYVHEMGHVWAFRRYGIEVSPPMFVPGLGAFVRGAHYPRAPWPQADVALSGPLWGLASGVIVLAAALLTGKSWLGLSAVFVAEMNLFNLIPVWQLDGNRALAALSRRQAGILGAAGLVGGLLAGSPLGIIAAGGHLVRTVVSPPQAGGEHRAFWTFLGVVVGLLVLRVVAPLVTGLHAEPTP